MADTSRIVEFPDTQIVLSLEEGIAAIEDGIAAETINVEIGEDIIVCADGPKGLQGLLQRLRGHRKILALSSGEIAPSVVAMRSGKPDMHPDVAIILDALKDQG